MQYTKPGPLHPPFDPVHPFATVRLRTAKPRGCVSRPGILSMVCKLVKSAVGRGRALRGSELIAKVNDRRPVKKRN